ncbi:hypothetical protein SK854_45610 [Lentzea sp. BCCO 10_0061]|uniref:Uncharacterized protein n=1 Tax=Lentzea sokolovensis TaxID=3095429 RepID=A0ABU4VCC3_9PSEU|nr:hypothetical protein [Lentzea sp. BCCO 10_0061]MDX8149468.1 hypothetical protein [Lentzea sp. BCCO 10_0061]
MPDELSAVNIPGVWQAVAQAEQLGRQAKTFHEPLDEANINSEMIGDSQLWEKISADFENLSRGVTWLEESASSGAKRLERAAQMFEQTDRVVEQLGTSFATSISRQTSDQIDRIMSGFSAPDPLPTGGPPPTPRPDSTTPNPGGTGPVRRTPNVSP